MADLNVNRNEIQFIKETILYRQSTIFKYLICLIILLKIMYVQTHLFPSIVNENN